MKQTGWVTIGDALKILGRREVSFAIVTVVMFGVRRRVTKATTEAWPRSLARATAFGLLVSVNRYLRRKIILSGLPSGRIDNQIPD